MTEIICPFTDEACPKEKCLITDCVLYVKTVAALIVAVDAPHGEIIPRDKLLPIDISSEHIKDLIIAGANGINFPEDIFKKAVIENLQSQGYKIKIKSKKEISCPINGKKCQLKECINTCQAKSNIEGAIALKNEARAIVLDETPSIEEMDFREDINDNFNYQLAQISEKYNINPVIIALYAKRLDKSN